jgi:putative intracellular protease/amidase
VPQIDTNGFSIPWHATDEMTEVYIDSAPQFADPNFDVAAYRHQYAALAERRERELQLLERHLGRLPITDPLPSTDPEVLAFRPELLHRLQALQPKRYRSLPELIRMHRDPSDDFTFADFDFIHAPGGHAPMVDFHENRWLGEVLHLARENRVYISLICHAPIALTSTNWRVDDGGTPVRVEDNAFLAAEVTTVGREGETGMLDQGYVHIPPGPTRLEYFVDEALREAGFTVRTAPIPTSMILLPNAQAGLVTGNGPQTVDIQAADIRSALTTPA